MFLRSTKHRLFIYSIDEINFLVTIHHLDVVHKWVWSRRVVCLLSLILAGISAVSVAWKGPVDLKVWTFHPLGCSVRTVESKGCFVMKLETKRELYTVICY